MTVRSKINAAYTLMFLDLLKTPFTKWKAYGQGIIDRNGNILIQDPKVRDDVWSRFHQSVATVKQLVNKGLPENPKITSLHRKMKIVREEYNISLDDPVFKQEFPVLFEEMVSGDAGGNPEDIAAGKNSGAVVYKSPQNLNKKKKVKRKMNEMMGFTQYIDNAKTEEAAKLQEAVELEEKAKVLTRTDFVSIGGNSVMVEVNETEIVNSDVFGSTSKQKVQFSEMQEAYSKGGIEAIHVYLKEATCMAWKIR